jgi:predicted nucleotidyltransferase component of viral defense system
MFPSAVYTKHWISQVCKKLDGETNPALMLKCIYALTLLGKLEESGLQFVFKGGTSMLLHLPEIRRLSIDIDIMTGASAEEITLVVGKIGKEDPFSEVVEDDRGERGQPNRRHFKFYFKTEAVKEGRSHVLLDVVMEGNIAHDVVRKPIATSFLIPDREILVRVPTIDSLLADKLNAASPTTTGVPLRKKDGTSGESMQVAKQLFDVGILLEHATDFAQISRVYAAIQAQ